MLAHEHTVHQHQSHFGWCNSNPPVLTVAPGSTIEFHPTDASGGQLTPESTVQDIARIDFARVNPVTGPVYIDGAVPGDAIKVTILEMQPSGWGWTATATQPNGRSSSIANIQRATSRTACVWMAFRRRQG